MGRLSELRRSLEEKRSIARNGEVARSFRERVRALPAPRVLELGTRRVDPTAPSRRGAWVPHAALYLGVDVAPGPDVDLVADAHQLAAAVGEARFDLVIACSVFEHLARPWIAAVEIARVLRPGGLVFVQTHQTFPLHAHPHDYWRFSIEALRLIFEDAGLNTLDAAYEYRARIFSRETPRAPIYPAYLNVCILAERP
ncbi:MAG: class I SAM-dependent methyltransferase [Thermoanaerobaculaceae bacterium]|mgnify:CR=1 FL=1|nr:class I SAM-dependent methyltransferase [Thermoanaerobaculaceae bacterium]HPW56991.1 methyltransferase domain-containing protein [Thermoanaerobaculaceae bacterium]